MIPYLYQFISFRFIGVNEKYGDVFIVRNKEL